MTASPQGPFRLEAAMLGALPAIDHFLSRLGLARLLDDYVPSGDGRVRLTHQVDRCRGAQSDALASAAVLDE